MSRRITYSSSIKDGDLAKKAVQALGASCRVAGTRLEIVGGKLRGVNINLDDGQIISDSDYGYSRSDFEDLSQAYSEHEFLRDASKNGDIVEQREMVTIDGQSCVKLTVSTNMVMVG